MPEVRAMRPHRQGLPLPRPLDRLGALVARRAITAVGK